MKFHQKVFLILLCLLPVQFGYHFWPSWSFVFGIRVDYLSPTIFLTDILVLTLLTSWLIEKKLKLSFLPLLVIFFFALSNMVLANVWQVALFKWLKILELGFLAYYVKENWQIIKGKIEIPILISICLTLFIAFFQMILQRNIGGIFYYLGERSFSASSPGIALFDFFGKSMLRPYGTFPHPNALAGFALVLFFLTKNKLSKFLAFLLIAISFSQAAWISFVAIWLIDALRLVLTNKKLKGFLLVLFLMSIFLPPVSKLMLANFSFAETIQTRLELNYLSGKVFISNPIFGVGAGNFIVAAPRVLANNVIWLLQPVHNIYLLTLSEVGIVGLVLFYFLLSKVTKPNLSLIAILLVGLVDHYWITLQQNMLLFSIILGFSFARVRFSRGKIKR